MYSSMDHGCILSVMTDWYDRTARIPLETHKIQSIIQLLIGKDRHQNELCKLCSQFFYSTHHVLFECIDMRDCQIMFWKVVTDNCDNLLVQEMEKMSYFVRCKFILNGFNVKYTPEWQSIYTTIGNYVFKVYKEYHKKCKNDIY